jgi:hypothetical protein
VDKSDRSFTVTSDRLGLAKGSTVHEDDLTGLSIHALIEAGHLEPKNAAARKADKADADAVKAAAEFEAKAEKDRATAKGAVDADI